MSTTEIRFKASVCFGALLALASSVVAAGCDTGKEGDRCNPNLSHDECGENLVCSGYAVPAHPLPGSCVESYCCPTDPKTSSIPYCNGTDTTCSAPDAASDAAPE